MRSVKLIRTATVALTALLAVVLLAGCGGSDPENVVLTHATFVGEGSRGPNEDQQRWRDLVTEKSGGTITFEVHYSSTLLPIQDMLEGVGAGVADVGSTAAGFVSGRIPEMQVLELLGALPLYPKETWLAATEEMMPIVDGLLEEHNVKLVTMVWSPPHEAVHTNKLMDKLSDWQGESIRVAGAGHAKNAEAWGATPVRIPPTDLYTALQRGTADGALFPASLTAVFKLTEVAPFITEMRGNGQNAVDFINLDTFNGLHEDQQKAIIEAGHEALAPSWDSEVALLKAIRAQRTADPKVTFHLMTDEEWAPFEVLLTPAYQEVGGVIWDDVLKNYH
jgi:TRAP-type C4-dicarboxylate transport system substrate-binding protein